MEDEKLDDDDAPLPDPNIVHDNTINQDDSLNATLKYDLIISKRKDEVHHEFKKEAFPTKVRKKRGGFCTTLKK